MKRTRVALDQTRVIPPDCSTCKGWRTVVNPDGKGTSPCPGCTGGQR